jgi:hypothetical protein
MSNTAFFTWMGTMLLIVLLGFLAGCVDPTCAIRLDNPPLYCINGGH